MKKMYSILGAAIFMLAFQPIHAQLNLNWEELGPNNLGNHARAMAVDGNGTVWAGAAGSGLWKSTNNGASWEPVAGLEDNQAVSSIKIDGQNMYVGTGEVAFYRADPAFIPQSQPWPPTSIFSWQHGFFQYAGMPGQGVFVSNDGGSTWSHSNGTWNSNSTFQNNPFVSIQSIQKSGQRTYIATLEGLYYSDDANLSTLTKATGSPVFESSPIMDIAIGASGSIFACTKDSIYLSTNNGAAFPLAINDRIQPASPLPGNQVGGDRIVLRTAPSNPNYLYVSGVISTNHSSSGVWRSTDNGQSFQRIAPKESSSFQPLQGNGRYALTMEIDPANPDRIFYGGATLYEYSDAKGWSNTVTHNFVGGLTTNYVPVPVLSLAFNPNNSDVLFLGTDKEIMGSFDGGQTYAFKSKGFNAAHLQAVSVTPFDEILASDRYQGMLHKESINSNVYQQEYNVVRTTSRGGIGRFSITKPEFVITQHRDGGLYRSTNSGASYEPFYGPPLTIDSCMAGDNNLYVDRPSATDSSQGLYDPRVAPVNPWIMDEYIPAGSRSSAEDIRNTPSYLYFCSANYLWTVSAPFAEFDTLSNWTRISLDLIEGSSLDYEFFTALAVSGDQDHVLYAGTNFGKLYRIAGAHDPFSLSPCDDVIRLDTLSGMPEGWISAIAVDPNDPENVVVTYGGYAPNTTRVWLSNDGKSGNSSFRDVTGNLPTDLPVYAAAFSPQPSQGALVLGTENGIYASSSNYGDPNAILSWNAENAGLGNVPVYDVGFRKYRAVDLGFGDYAYDLDNTLFIATHGRGAFRSQTLVSTKPPAEVPETFDLVLAPNPADQSTRIGIEMRQAGRVEIVVHDITGNPVRKLPSQKWGPGNHELELSVAELATGMYLVTAWVETKDGLSRKNVRLVVTH